MAEDGRRRRLRAPRRRARPLVERRPRRHRARRALAVARSLRRVAAVADARHARRLRDPERDPGRADRAGARDRRAPQHARLRRSRPTCSPSSATAGSRSRSAPTGTGISKRRSKRPGSTGTRRRRSCRRRGSAPASRTRASTTSCSSGPASRPATRSSSATRGRATWKARARAGLRPVYVRRPHLGPDATAPDDHHEQDVHRATDLRVVLDLD